MTEILDVSVQHSSLLLQVSRFKSALAAGQSSSGGVVDTDDCRLDSMPLPCEFPRSAQDRAMITERQDLPKKIEQRCRPSPIAHRPSPIDQAALPPIAIDARGRRTSAGRDTRLPAAQRGSSVARCDGGIEKYYRPLRGLRET
jgi:hypothetical protein